LATSQSKSEKRYYQLHLSFNNQRSSSPPITAETEPSFNHSSLFLLSSLPSSYDDWERVVNRGGSISICLTLNGSLINLGEDEEKGRKVRGNKAYRELVAMAVVEWRQVLMRQGQVFSVELQVSGGGGTIVIRWLRK